MTRSFLIRSRRFWLYALIAVSQGVAAQAYPARPITIILPQEPGGPGDVVARFLAQAMGKPLQQKILIENVGGAGGNIGVARAAKANPDGHTLLLQHIGISTSPALYRKLEVNPITDFEPIGLVADVPLMLLARGNFPPNNFAEFLAYARLNRDKLSYANAGLGSASHLCGLLFMSAIGVNFNTVSYKGTGPAMNDMIGGHVDIMCDAQTPASAGNIQAGKIKVYGVSSRSPVATLPKVPTLDSLGVKDFEVTVWRGVFAPKNTPQPILDKLVISLQEAIRDADFLASLAKLGTRPVPQDQATPDALRRHLKSEIDKWGTVIRQAGQYAD
ncbi:MAG: tripartite tricarboxylate transporter substrate binding protein BugD [Betaproteobacteria bacterium]|nr:tripartite tricarboxylate transporter substrate binding protein BugD [Betaproteobacteria bacterium]